MRLDKFLKVSRLIKRRTVANEACDNGRISANGRVVKASYDVKVGDRLEIALGGRTLAVEVLQVYTGTGSCDVDDLILNLAGALLVFIICRITPLWHRICSVNPRPKK